MPLERIDDDGLRFVLLENIILFYLIVCKDLCVFKLAEIKLKQNMVFQSFISSVFFAIALIQSFPAVLRSAIMEPVCMKLSKIAIRCES